MSSSADTAPSSSQPAPVSTVDKTLEQNTVFFGTRLNTLPTEWATVQAYFFEDRKVQDFPEKQKIRAVPFLADEQGNNLGWIHIPGITNERITGDWKTKYDDWQPGGPQLSALDSTRAATAIDQMAQAMSVALGFARSGGSANTTAQEEELRDKLREGLVKLVKTYTKDSLVHCLELRNELAPTLDTQTPDPRIAIEASVFLLGEYSKLSHLRFADPLEREQTARLTNAEQKVKSAYATE